MGKQLENENSRKKEKKKEKYGLRELSIILERFWDFKHILIYTLKRNTLEKVAGTDTHSQLGSTPFPVLLPATLLYCGEARGHWLELQWF